MLKKAIIFFFWAGLFIFFPSRILSAAKEPANPKKLPQVVFFFSQTCHACQKTKAEVMPGIEREFFDKVVFDYLDIANLDNYKLMLSLRQKYNVKKDGVPAVFVEGTFLVGYPEVKEGLRNAISGAIEKGRRQGLYKLPGIDLAKRFLSFGLLAIISAGLIDGINPCAFTVIVFFVSFLAFQGYRKRELAAIGLTFIAAVFLTYVSIGVGIFRFLYSINKFYLVTRIIYYAIAALCFILGILALYDLWVFKKTKKAEGMTLQLPRAVKNRIQAIIGMHYRKTQKGNAEGGRHFAALLGSAFITGFLVSLLEAVCTGQMYLPTITFVMKESSLRMRAFGYLLLYNTMFIFPLLLVLIFALYGTTSEQFAKFAKGHMLAVKLLMAFIFFALGFFMLMGV
jgi:thiol-disulfide isomerase/thioredoxin